MVSPADRYPNVTLLFVSLSAASLTVTLLGLDVTGLPSVAASIAVAVAVLVTEPAVTSSEVTVYGAVEVQVTVSPVFKLAGSSGHVTATLLSVTE